jgi:outer membrane scaffolding protein for murein synthesis (MipA/OmpV family)
MKLVPRLVLLAALLWTGVAAAQTPSPFTTWQNAAGIVLAPLGGPVPDWRVTLGGGAVYMPLYEGADHYHLQPAPAIDIRYKDIAFASIGDGIGVNLLSGDYYRAGIAVGYDVGRDQHLAGRLNGLGNIGTAAEPRLFVEYSILPAVLTADLRRGIGGHEGVIGDLGAYMPVVGNETLVVFVGPQVTFANQRYMQSYFGVSTAQALSSRAGLPAYRANGGLKDVMFGATAIYRLTQDWLIDAGVSYERILGSATNSPIVQDPTQLGISVILAYDFF